MCLLQTGVIHLFEKSVIIFKAWCMYESRILASHQSLLSTYALETLALFVINTYHEHIRTPLCVLSLLLRLLSNFDFGS